MSFKWFYAAAGDRDDSVFRLQLTNAQNTTRLQVSDSTDIRPSEIYQKTHTQGILKIKVLELPSLFVYTLNSI